jgi:hypothetical protein
MEKTVIATTPSAMVAAQTKLLGWLDTKLAACDEERKEAEALLVQLRMSRTSTTHADRLLDNCRRRERFYQKVRAALDAGYYIVPPFDCQVFALRTDRASPPANEGQGKWPGEAKRVPALAPGAGEYVHPEPLREWSHEHKRQAKDGQMVTDTYYRDTEWKEVEFPVKAMKPELIEAASRAMQTKIFDALAIAPPYRAADPIIVGQIKHWKSNRTPLTFFVAWWLDEKDI